MLELYPPDELLVVAPKDPSMPEMGLNAALTKFETTPRPRGDFDDSEVSLLGKKIKNLGARPIFIIIIAPLYPSFTK
jgi:hypothetical protein